MFAFVGSGVLVCARSIPLQITNNAVAAKNFVIENLIFISSFTSATKKHKTHKNLL